MMVLVLKRFAGGAAVRRLLHVRLDVVEFLETEEEEEDGDNAVWHRHDESTMVIKDVTIFGHVMSRAEERGQRTERDNN